MEVCPNIYRVKDSWVETLPRNITLKEIVTIGTSGFTAFKALKKSFNIISKNLKKTSFNNRCKWKCWCLSNNNLISHWCFGWKF